MKIKIKPENIFIKEEEQPAHIVIGKSFSEKITKLGIKKFYDKKKGDKNEK